ncbi:tRNA nucleotidyltransferase [Massarina eburnea CBS 473.64]|uniref:tRNA nucleotidyltransferase n=1 Tax=Massarina eburnea CBS 473.64 TaxID=1395130 RepID=A0A6A6SC47_9PLEO|nr:tRNA nucleotidyltransferase [Massarina eburnea CBS 473.64]
MAPEPGSNSNPTTFELTESETQLRDLLLGVATYIDDASSDEASKEVPAELAKEKIVLRWTGGWVRDKLLGVGSHDVDVAINKMTGEHFGLKMLEYLKISGNIEKHGLDKKEGEKIVSGLHTIKANPEASKNLETATIRIMGIDLDLVNLRKETYNEVSRNPEMEFGTAEEDAMRRDATVNAMFYNLNTQKIEDFTGRGFEDMAAKIIRTPLEPYQTFKDDPLRVLRLIRFASRLDYTIEPVTAEAMANPEIQKALEIKIKRERVGIELEKMLRGPDPHMALSLIQRFKLYETIFTDPTRDIQSKPDIDYFAPAYDFIKSLQATDNDTVITQNLLRSKEEWYLAWVCAAVMPWADAPQVPNSKPSRPPYHAAYLVAQEGFKAPNKVSDVIAASLNHSDEIRDLVERRPKERDVLGMAIRRWGSTWRAQVLFSLVYEIVLGSVSKERVLNQYSAFLSQLVHENLLDADTFKPLVNGKELASAMSIKPGPWMKDALDVVMTWQLRNPDVKDVAQAIEEVKKSRNSELPSRLISHFLSLTVPPLFPQTSSSSSRKIMGEAAKPWKNPKNEYFLDLLRWSLMHAEGADVKNNMHLIRPPIMEMLDDTDLSWRARGCELVKLLIEAAPSDFITKHGYDKMFSTELLPFFNFLPSLTPETESVTLLEQTFPALIALYHATGKDEKFLDRLVREGVLTPLHHFPTPNTYPKLASLLINQLATLVQLLQINSVKHLQPVLPLLGAIIQDPLTPSHPPLLLAATKTTQSVVENGWPRFDAGRCMEVYAWICKAWLNCTKLVNTELEDVKTELGRLFGMLDKLMTKHDNEDVKTAWEVEKKRVGEQDLYRGLF